MFARARSLSGPLQPLLAPFPVPTAPDEEPAQSPSAVRFGWRSSSRVTQLQKMDSSRRRRRRRRRFHVAGRRFSRPPSNLSIKLAPLVRSRVQSSRPSSSCLLFRSSQPPPSCVQPTRSCYSISLRFIRYKVLSGTARRVAPPGGGAAQLEPSRAETRHVCAERNKMQRNKNND